MTQSIKAKNTFDTLCKHLQSDVDSILSDFSHYMMHRDDEDAVRVHLDVDLILQKMSALAINRNQNRYRARPTIHTYRKAVLTPKVSGGEEGHYNPHFYTPHNHSRRPFGRLNQAAQFFLRNM